MAIDDVPVLPQQMAKHKTMTILYGIKHCDTVKKARKWLDSHQVQHTFHDFRNDGITLTLINEWLQHKTLDDIINRRSTTWKHLLEEDKQTLLNHTGLEPILAQPTLIKRPVLACKNTVLIGFKADEYAALLSA